MYVCVCVWESEKKRFVGLYLLEWLMTGWFIAVDCMISGFRGKKKNVTTCCVYAMYTSALVNGCERFIQYSKLYVCVESMWKDVCTVCVFVWERVWSVEGCGHMSNCEWTLCNGKCRWCDVKGSCSFPADHLNSNEVNTGHRLWRSTLLYNLPPATQKEKTLKKKISAHTALSGNT